MKLREDTIDGVRVVRIEESRLDTNVSSELKTELLRLVENEGAVNLLIDLKLVEYVDSSGLGALLFGHRHVNANAGSLKLVNLNQKVKTLIRIANLESIFPNFEDEQHAIESF